MGSIIRFRGSRLDPATLRALATGTLIEGNKLSAWWGKQSTDFLDQFMREIRTSMQNGESVTQAITRVAGGTVDGVQVPGIMKTTKAKAGALVATATNRVSNEAALQSFQANKDVIKWITQLSTLDNRTSDICVAYSGQTWDIETLQPVNGSTLPFNGGPPRHFNCRSRLRPVTKSFEELGVKAKEIPTSTRASMDGQVPADITFDTFLKNKGETFQNKLLGPARAKLWREQKITLTQLVDMRGNPMSLRQLEQRAGITGAAPTEVKGVARIQSLGDDIYVETNVPDEVVRKVFTTNKSDKDNVMVMLHRDILEEGWKKDQGYIPADLSENTIGNRIKGFEDFLKDNNVIRVGNVSVDDATGRISFGDGRHRARVLLNRGMTRVPVSMSRESLEQLQRYYKTSFANRTPLTEAQIARFKELERQMEKLRIERFKAAQQARRKLKAEIADAEKAARKEQADRIRAQRKAARERAERARAATARAEQEARDRNKPRGFEPDDVETIKGEQQRAHDEIFRFLHGNGYTSEQIREHLPLDLLDSIDPTIAKNMLGIIKDSVEKAAKRTAALEKATNALPDKIPVFKTSAEAEAWTRKFLIRDKELNTVWNTMETHGPRVTKKWNRVTREYEVTETFDDLVGWGKYDRKFYRVIAEVTSMMSKRFNMKLPNYIGIKRRHPNSKFKAGKELASVHMNSDSLLLPTTITNKKKVLERARWQETSNRNAWSKAETGLMQGLEESAEAYLQQDFPHAEALIKALKSARKNQDLPFTATSVRGAAFDELSEAQKQAMYIWDTIVHESGHRLHGQFKQRVDDVLNELFRTKNMTLPGKRSYANIWARQVSEYATANEREFLAESFTRYMMGDHDRIYPPLRALFDELDTDKLFGIDDISALFKEFAE